MDTERQRRLISLLNMQSEAGIVDWTASPKAGAYDASFSNGSVRIRLDDDLVVSGTEYIVELINNEGQVAETIDEEIFGKGPAALNGREILRNLYELARRKSLRSDELLDGIISDLEDWLPRNLR